MALHVQPVDEELDAVGAHAVGAARLQLQRLEPLPKLVEEVHLVEAGEVDVDDADLVHAVVQDHAFKDAVVHAPVLGDLHVQEAPEQRLVMRAHATDDARGGSAHFRCCGGLLRAEQFPAAMKTVVPFGGEAGRAAAPGPGRRAHARSPPAGRRPARRRTGRSPNTGPRRHAQVLHEEVVADLPLQISGVGSPRRAWVGAWRHRCVQHHRHVLALIEGAVDGGLDGGARRAVFADTLPEVQPALALGRVGGQRRLVRMVDVEQHSIIEREGVVPAPAAQAREGRAALAVRRLHDGGECEG